MLYVPIQIYPNERSVRGCVVLAAVFLGLAAAAFINLNHVHLRVAVTCFCMVGMCVNILKMAAALRSRPMLKVLDDRFSVYTPFGYVMVRFGEVLAFRKGGMPGMRTLRVDINQASRPKFPSGLSRLLYSLIWLSFGNTVAVPAYMLGAELDPVMRMLENRRLAAVRMDAVDGYEPRVVTSMS